MASTSTDHRTLAQASGSNGQTIARAGGKLRRIDGAHAQGRPATNNPVHQLLGVQILGTGSYVPERVIHNDDLARLGCDTDWIQQRTGILQRRHVAAGQTTTDMAYEAAVRCLDAAGASASEIDLTIVGTFTPDTHTPSAACRLQYRLGAKGPAMDLNAACSGFIYSLITGMQFIATGTAKRALIVGADTISPFVNPEEKKTYPLFGDAAGAVLLGRGGNDQGLVAYTWGADGAGAELLCLPGGGSREPMSHAMIDQGDHFLRMDGLPVFKWAVRLVPEMVRDVLTVAGMQVADLDLAIFHQANLRILDAVAKEIGIPEEKVLVNLDRYGNTSAGSIPLALDEAARGGRIQRGDHVLVAGFGAGLSWGTTILQW